MKKITIVISLFLLHTSSFFGQQEDFVTLSFEAKQYDNIIKLDSISIENITRGGKIILREDTIIELTPTSIYEQNITDRGINLFQNYPNPFSKKTNIRVNIPERDILFLNIYDLTGRKLASYESEFDKGTHLFSFYASNEQGYILTVNSNKYSKQRQLMIQTGKSERATPIIKYKGLEHTSESYSYTPNKSDDDFLFELGDDLLFIGYVTYDAEGVLYDNFIEQNITEDKHYIFEIPGFYNLFIEAYPTAGGTVRGRGRYPEGKEVEIGATPFEGYEFSSWFGDTETVNSTTSEETTIIIPNKNISLVANFDKKKYNVTVEANPEEGGIVSGDGYYSFEDKVPLRAVANDGYTFINWTNEDNEVLSNSDSYDYEMPKNDVVITGNFQETEYFSLYIDIEGEGEVEINPDEELYPVGAEVNLKAIPGDGLFFKGWTGDYEGKEDNITITMTKDKNITANFGEPETDEYILTIGIEGSGHTNPPAGQYILKENDEIIITANPSHKWELVEWLENENEHIGSELILEYVMPADEVLITAVFEESPFVCGEDNFTYHGYHYSTIEIDNKCWFAENLVTSRYSDGSNIPGRLNNLDWETTTSGAFDIYNHAEVPGINSEAQMAQTYGKLYNWYAVNDDRGLCPEGWHVPSNNEWTQLTNYLQDYYFLHNDASSKVIEGVGNALKSCKQIYSPEEGCNTMLHPRWTSHQYHYGYDKIDFSALPGGIKRSSGGYSALGETGYWWSSTEQIPGRSFYRTLFHSTGHLGAGDGNQNIGLSVRCVKDIAQ